MLPRLAIPSYKRSDTISGKTLKFLKDSNYPADKINIFVASYDEWERYNNAVDPDLYNEIIIGRPGLMEQRNFITEFYPEDEIIVQMDDDVKTIKSTLPLLSIVEMGVEHLEYRTAGLFGVLPIDDGRRFKQNITKHLTHILGSFFVCRNHKNILITHTEKEDMERSVLYFKRYGQVLRYQGAGVCTNYGKGTGGLQADVNRQTNITTGITNMRNRYPEYISVVVKNDKTTDIILNWRVKPTFTL
jgi:hypothetical protein